MSSVQQPNQDPEQDLKTLKQQAYADGLQKAESGLSKDFLPTSYLSNRVLINAWRRGWSDGNDKLYRSSTKRRIQIWLVSFMGLLGSVLVTLYWQDIQFFESAPEQQQQAQISDAVDDKTSSNRIISDQALISTISSGIELEQNTTSLYTTNIQSLSKSSKVTSDVSSVPRVEPLTGRLATPTIKAHNLQQSSLAAVQAKALLVPERSTEASLERLEKAKKSDFLAQLATSTDTETPATQASATSKRFLPLKDKQSEKQQPASQTIESGYAQKSVGFFQKHPTKEVALKQQHPKSLSGKLSFRSHYQRGDFQRLKHYWYFNDKLVFLKQSIPLISAKKGLESSVRISSSRQVGLWRVEVRDAEEQLLDQVTLQVGQ